MKKRIITLAVLLALCLVASAAAQTLTLYYVGEGSEAFRAAHPALTTRASQQDYNNAFQLAAVMLKKEFGEFKKLLDPNEVGGTPFLGIGKPVIKAHGASNARAIYNAIRQARDFASSGFIADVEQNIDIMKVAGAAQKD